MKLIVVESPSKSKTIQKYVGSGYVIRPTVGHIADLSKDGKNKLGVEIENNFKPKYKVLPDKKDKIAAIKDAARQADEILIASDPDREGEAIGWHVYNQLKNLKKPIKRILFHEITKDGIKDALSKPGELDKDLFDAQQARRVLDRLVGFLVSPYIINTFGPGLSAGRVQSVCLRMIVDREKEREAFVPEIFFDITAALAKKRSEKFIAKYPNKVTDEKKAKKIKKDLDESSFVVEKIIGKEQKRNPPPPLTTSKLQQSASSLFKFSASKTMKAAQALYEKGFVTYIRTDSLRCSSTSIKSLREWLQLNNYDVPKKQNFYKNKDASQDAHEAIRPTDVEMTPDMFVGSSVDEQKVYKLIWDRFVASQMNPAIYDTVTVDIKASSGHMLRANGRTLKYAGWLTITKDVDSKKDEQIQLPPMKKNDELFLVPPKVKAEKKETKPPARYSEGSLIKELEKKGIGRPSTYAAILSKISDRRYVEKKKNQYIPTDLGRTVVDDLIKYFSFMKYEYTKEMELQLDKIEYGKLKYEDMLSDFFAPFKKELRIAQNSQHKDVNINCEKCNNKMVLKHGMYGYYIACVGYPDCKNTKSVKLDGDDVVVKTGGREIVDNIKCPKCNSGMFKLDGKFGPFYSCETYPKCKGKRKVPFGKKCPKCKSELFLTVFQEKPKLGCMGYPNCKHVEEVPDGSKIDWVPPQRVNRKKDKKIERILKKSEY